MDQDIEDGTEVVVEKSWVVGREWNVIEDDEDDISVTVPGLDFVTLVTVDPNSEVVNDESGLVTEDPVIEVPVKVEWNDDV